MDIMRVGKHGLDGDWMASGWRCNVLDVVYIAKTYRELDLNIHYVL